MNTQYVLAVPDLDRSVKFYQKVMGFKAMPVEDDGWIFMVRDQCTIRLGECPSAIPPQELGDHSYFAYIEVDDIDGYYKEVQSANGKTLRAPRDEPWGMREFPLVTVDGHRIMIGQRI